MGFFNKYALAIKLVAFGLLIGALFWMRGDLNKAKGERDLAVAEATQLRATNEQNERVIEGFSKQRLDNDAIAAAVVGRLEGNRARTEASRQAIRNASNDPSVRAWADSPVPNGVRGIIEGQAPRR